MLSKILRYRKLLVIIFGLILLSSCAEENLIWHQAQGYRIAELPVSGGESIGFIKLDSTSTGIHFINRLTHEQIISNQHLLDGSGVALGDIDNDGYCDIYFCRLDGPNILYRNLGNWQFEDITERSGVSLPDRYSKGSAFADLDGDNDLDLLVTVMDGPNACFMNDGKGNFSEVTDKVGLSSITDRTGNTSLAIGDVDGDGDLDIYMVSYRFKARRDRETPILNADGLMLYQPDYGERDILYLNDGKGNFKDVELLSDTFKRENGDTVMMPRAWGLNARMQDMDDDGDPDIYVCNDFASSDFIWINNGEGKFQAIPVLAVRTTSSSSMTVDFADIDRDGNLDFFVADMLSRDHKRRKMQMGAMARSKITVGKIYDRPQIMRNTVFLNRGDRTYAEIGNYSGLYASDWTWSAIFMDVDLDGYEDLLTTTGHAYDVQDYDTQQKIIKQKVRTIDKLRQTIFMYPRLDTENFVFQNNRDLTFKEMGKDWGFDTKGISHGMALGDLDNDGDLDVITNNYESLAGIYQNISEAPRIAVRLRGLAPNTQGIGAKIKLSGFSGVTQIREIISGGHYLSGSEPLAVFAAGKPQGQMQMEVIWRSGRRSIIEDVKANCIYEIDESDAKWTEKSISHEPDHYFEDVSDQLNHIHEDEAFNDFYRQSLLPNQLSQLGPGISWYDIDQDQDDDLIITSGKGGILSVYQNSGSRGFIKMAGSSLSPKATDDQTGALFFEQTAGEVSMIVGVSNYEKPSILIPSASIFRFKNNQFVEDGTIGKEISSTGPIALSDYDNDGDLDLFVGGRVIGGKYPDAASSNLYHNVDGKFEIDKVNSEKLNRLGLISGSIFSDIDLDGDSDLILAVEWGPIMIFQNNSGQFVDVTEQYGLSDIRGWWNGLTTGDLDEDGRLDIIATNWGLNSKYHYNPDHPLKIYYDDFDNNGVLDIVEAHYDPYRRSVVPERGFSCMSRAMPFIKSKMASFEQYGGANLDEIMGTDLKYADSLWASTLAHTLFLNRGDKFEISELPTESQFSPAFAVIVADYNGDGHDDIFLAQNFFATQPETPRNDGGRGLWLKGNGMGDLESVPGQLSGIKVYGEQRGAAISDYNRDGRIDLAVSQNGAHTKLYKNVLAKPGIRIRLLGPDENPTAVGAVVQLIFNDKMGPAKQIHAGSGYWSQDSPVLVFGIPEQPQKIKIRWPGGKISESEVPAGSKDISVNTEGQVIINR